MLSPQRRTTDPLDGLLALARRDSVEFPVLLANHAPMMLVALRRLGASDARLHDFLAIYRAANGLVEMPLPAAPVNASTWTDFFGDRTREADYRAFFAGEVERLGAEEAVAQYLPLLVPGIAASALHALMRLAYGVMQRDAAEVGTALGYWAATYLPLPPSTGAPPITDDPAAVLAGVASLSGVRDVVPESDLLWHNIKAVAWSPCFEPVLDWLQVDGTTPARMAATALRLFAGTQDFAALHALTGMHWVRLVLPYCPTPELLLAHFWRVIAALVPKIGFPALPDAVTTERLRQSPCPDWAAILVAAARSNDEHDISLAFSAHEEEKAYGDRLYRVVAARRLGLIA